MPQERLYEENSPAHYASVAIGRIKKLSESQKISDKLQSFNIFLFILVVGLILTSYFETPSTTFSVISFIIFLIFSSIISLGYAPILEMLTNIATNKVESLRLSISVLFIAITAAIAGLAFNATLLINLSLFLVGIQLILIPLSIVLPKSSESDKEVVSSQLWTIVGRTSSVLGILSFVIDMFLIFMRIW